MDFIEKFSGYTNVDLLKIVENADEYEESEVEAAKYILSTRNVTRGDLEQVIKEGEVNENKKPQVTQLKRLMLNVLSIISPIAVKKQSVDEIIKRICIVMSVMFLLLLYRIYDILYYGSIDDIYFILSILIVPLAMILIMIILFYRRKKIGWILLTILHAVNVIQWSILLSSSLQTGSKDIVIFQRPSPFLSAIIFLLFTTNLLGLCKKDVREIYGINNNSMIATIGITAFIIAFIFYLLFI